MEDWLFGLVPGMVIGFGIYWLIDSWINKLKPPVEDSTKAIELQAEIDANKKTTSKLKADLASSEKEVSELKSQIVHLESNPVQVIQKTSPKQSTQPIGETASDLKAVTSIPQEHLQKLIDSGITTPADLAIKSPDDILGILEAQPWDDIDPTPWIEEAKFLTEDSQPTNNLSTDIFSEIEGITESQIQSLQQAGIITFAELSNQSEEKLLEIVDAQPWDDIDVTAWINQAKEKA